MNEIDKWPEGEVFQNACNEAGHDLWDVSYELKKLLNGDKFQNVDYENVGKVWEQKEERRRKSGEGRVMRSGMRFALSRISGMQ